MASTWNQTKSASLIIKFNKLVKLLHNKQEDSKEQPPSPTTPSISPTTPVYNAQHSDQVKSIRVWNQFDEKLDTQPRRYRLLSTKATSLKAMPRYHFTQQEHLIMHQAWHVLTNKNKLIIISEFKQLIWNDEELTYVLLANKVDIREQFDIIYDMFDKIITAKEYHHYQNSLCDDIITTTTIVLKLIGIRQAE
eukprot:93688_1